MNRNKIILLSLSLLYSNFAYSAAPKTCLQRSYRELKKIMLYTVVITYVHQNIMTQQNLAKLPSLSVDEINDYSRKLKTTLSNGCTSLDSSYTSLKKLMTGLESDQISKFKSSFGAISLEDLYGSIDADQNKNISNDIKKSEVKDNTIILNNSNKSNDLSTPQS